MLRQVGSAFFCGLIVGLLPFLLLAQGSDQVQTPGITQELLVSSTLSQFPGKQI